MKKIFLITGILAFTVAAAQQNEFFDIQKHLQEKSKKERNQKEQSLLLSNRGFRIKSSAGYLSNPNQYTPNSNQYTLLPNGNKVYSLARDHMPCIVPDMHQFNMPNMAKANTDLTLLINRKPGAIPNGVTPYRIIPPTK